MINSKKIMYRSELWKIIHEAQIIHGVHFYLASSHIQRGKGIGNKDNELEEYLQKKELERAEELKRSREENQTVKFTSVKPPRKDPNRGMRFVRCTEPINKGKLGSSRSFIKKKDKEYY